MKKHFCILCIEKSDQIRRALEQGEVSWPVRSASSFQSAAAILRTEEIHLIIAHEDLLSVLEDIIPLYPDPVKILCGHGKEPNLLIRALNCGGEIRRFVSDDSLLGSAVSEGLEIYARHRKSKKTVADLQYMLHKMNFLHEISAKISEKKPLPRLLDDIMESSREVMNAEASSLLLYDPGDNRLHFIVATGDKGAYFRKFSVDMGTGIAGWVGLHRQPLLIRDCYHDPRFNPEMDKKTSFRTRSMICVPLIRKEQLIGVMQVINRKEGGFFEERDQTIFETMASQCAIAIENARLIEIQVETEAMERELDTAREIQQSLLPDSLPEYADIQCAAALIPARQVGGDYYSIIKIGEDRSLFFIADVVGKSISAALIVSTLYSCLHTYIKLNQDNFDLSTLVTGMNLVILESVTPDKFVTAWFGLYHHDSGILRCINAGHNRPMIFRKGMEKPIELKSGGFALGVFDMPYRAQEIQMRRDDVLVLYTDGITEAWNREEDQYENRRLIRLVSGHRGKSAAGILDEIRKDVKKHVDSAPQSDDLTCVVIRIERDFANPAA